jgi:hypothetical protein
VTPPMADTLELTSNHAMVLLDNLFVALWRQHTTLEGVAKFSEHVARAGKQHPGGLALLTIVPSSAPPPPGEVRAKLAAAFAGAQGVKASAVFFEGSGLRATIVRSVVTGLSLLAPPKFPHKVFGKLEESLVFLNGLLEATPGAARLVVSRSATQIDEWRRSLS